METDSKIRFSYNADKTKIRAIQGRSFHVDVEMTECVPPDILYHGTAEKYVQSIKDRGIIKKTRNFVHLSKDIPTAEKWARDTARPLCPKSPPQRCITTVISFSFRQTEYGRPNTFPSIILRNYSKTKYLIKQTVRHSEMFSDVPFIWLNCLVHHVFAFAAP